MLGGLVVEWGADVDVDDARPAGVQLLEADVLGVVVDGLDQVLEDGVERCLVDRETDRDIGDDDNVGHGKLFSVKDRALVARAQG